MILPQRRSCIPGMTRRDSRTTFIKVDSTPNRQLSSLSSIKRLTGGPPVLVTNISAWPKRPIVRWLQSSRSFAEETSATTATTSLRASISARVFSNSSALRAQIESLQPSCAKATAHALPMPLLAAATIATRPLIPNSILTLLQKSTTKQRRARRQLRIEDPGSMIVADVLRSSIFDPLRLLRFFVVDFGCFSSVAHCGMNDSYKKHPPSHTQKRKGKEMANRLPRDRPSLHYRKLNVRTVPRA